MTNDATNIGTKPVALIIAGHDPSGSAGLHADILSVHATGAHALSLISCFTAQNIDQCTDSSPTGQAVGQLQLQALSTYSVSAIKVGALCDLAGVELALKAKAMWPEAILIYDPVLASSSGYAFASTEVLKAVLDNLLPVCDAITPNANEAAMMTGVKGLQQQCQAFLDQGCGSVLISGGHSRMNDVLPLCGSLSASDDELVTVYFSALQQQCFVSPRLAGEFRGTGCRFSSLLSGFCAHGHTVINATAMAVKAMDKAMNGAYGVSLSDKTEALGTTQNKIPNAMNVVNG